MKLVFIAVLTSLLLTSCGFHIKLSSSGKSIEASGYICRQVTVTK